jgi:hypothetical protein
MLHCRWVERWLHVQLAAGSSTAAPAASAAAAAGGASQNHAMQAQTTAQQQVASAAATAAGAPACASCTLAKRGGTSSCTTAGAAGAQQAGSSPSTQGSGRATPSAADTAPTTPTAAAVAAATVTELPSDDNSRGDSTSRLAPPSVGHAAMDEEHEQCAAALARALQQPADLQVLAAAHAVLQDHFGHEEELMRAAGFGGQVGMARRGPLCAGLSAGLLTKCLCMAAFAL